MEKYLFVVLLIISPLAYSWNFTTENKCTKIEIVNLSIFKNNDYKLIGYMCKSEEGFYLKSYIENSHSVIFLNEYSDFSAKEDPELLAVSVYKPKIKKPPLMITINSAYYCCNPQMEGYMYKVKIYEIKDKNNIILKDVTKILGGNSEGFEGLAEGKVHYNFKDIASVKKWLDKNYK